MGNAQRVTQYTHGNVITLLSYLLICMVNPERRTDSEKRTKKIEGQMARSSPNRTCMYAYSTNQLTSK